MTFELDSTTTGIAFRVRGRVQGVSYRWFCQGAARELGLTGWVRNRSDGDVEGEAFGASNDLERLLERLREGPPAARVDDLDWQSIEGSSGSGFKIRC